MALCKECGKDFSENRPFQVFCNDYCRGAYHRRKYRQIAVEEAEDRREARLNGDGRGTEEERQKGNEVLARIIQKSGPKLVRRI
jgi:hypothetical protein